MKIEHFPKTILPKPPAKIHRLVLDLANSLVHQQQLAVAILALDADYELNLNSGHVLLCPSAEAAPLARQALAGQLA